MHKSSENATVRKNPMRKWAKNTQRHVSKKDIQVVNKPVKLCTKSLFPEEMQLKPQ